MATCADCRFHLAETAWPEKAWCRVRAPVVLSDSEVGVTTARRLVDLDDWCGEHQPVKPDAAASLSLMAEAIAPFLLVANAAVEESGELLISTDLTDGEGEPLNLSSADFIRLADAYFRATGA